MYFLENITRNTSLLEFKRRFKNITSATHNNIQSEFWILGIFVTFRNIITECEFFVPDDGDCQSHGSTCSLSIEVLKNVPDESIEHEITLPPTTVICV